MFVNIKIYMNNNVVEKGKRVLMIYGLLLDSHALLSQLCDYQKLPAKTLHAFLLLILLISFGFFFLLCVLFLAQGLQSQRIGR